MARYRVKETSFIADKLVEEGTIIEYTGIPAANLELIDSDVGAPGVEADGGFYQPEDASDLA